MRMGYGSLLVEERAHFYVLIPLVQMPILRGFFRQDFADPFSMYLDARSHHKTALAAIVLTSPLWAWEERIQGVYLTK
jgi:hypothetical protein